MLNRFRKEIAPIELYGKLPLAKDYLRIGGGKGAAIALRDWLDQGFSSQVERGAVPSVAWPARFMIGGYNGEPLMGCLWPSSDSGGLRPFPFASFMERRRKALTSDWESCGGTLKPIWDRLALVYGSHSRYSDGQSFLQSVRGQEIDVSAAPTAEAEQIDFDAWVGALWPDDGVDGLVETLVGTGGQGKFGPADPLRLPLVNNLPTLTQAHAWWFALVELGHLRRGDCPTVFFPQPHGSDVAPHFITFFRGPVKPAQQLWIGPIDGEIRPGDFGQMESIHVGEAPVAGESVPPLTASLRGPVASARARLVH